MRGSFSNNNGEKRSKSIPSPLLAPGGSTRAPSHLLLRGQCHQWLRRASIVSLFLCVVYFFHHAFPRLVKEQQQKYLFQTGTNRLDYYDHRQSSSSSSSSSGEDGSGGMITYTRREENEDEARLEEKSAHESDASGTVAEAEDVAESADTSGLDYASLPRVALKGDKLQCKCGRWKCESFDQPRVSFVISREFEDVGELLKVLNSIDGMDEEKGKDCEVLVNGDGLKSSPSSSFSSKGSKGEDGINALIAMIRKQGGFTNNLASYRNEPLERIVIVKSENGNNKNGDVMLERLVSGALAAKVRFVDSAGNIDEEAPTELKTTVLKRLRAVDSSSSGSSSSITPTSKAEVHPRVSFAVQYFKRPNLVQKIATQLVGYAIKYNFAVEVLINDDSATEIQEWHEALEQIPHAIVCAGNVHEIRGYNRLALMSRAQIVAVIQDDDLPPTEPNWLIQAEDNFYEHKKLALIAGLVGQIQGGPDTGRWGKQRGRHVKQIPYYDSKGRPFMFVSWANIGPFVLKRDAFLSTGMFHDSYSCRGDPGIGFDYEYGIRLWRNNKEVALQIMQFRYHVGASRSSGTRSSTSMKTRRDNIESRNTKLIHHVHKGFYVNHAPEGANKSPRAKAMSLKQTCKAAALPTLANNRLKKNKKDSKSGFFSG